jgi:tyrosine-protein phosphatase SIW14
MCSPSDSGFVANRGWKNPFPSRNPTSTVYRLFNCWVSFASVPLSKSAFGCLNLRRGILRPLDLRTLSVILTLVLSGISQDGVTDFGQLDIDEFGRINDNYYRGAQPKRDAYARLAALGIKAVVDLRNGGPHEEEALTERAGMKLYRIPMKTSHPPPETDIRRFLQIVNDPDNQPVFVHCEDGHIRTGVMTAIYRMTHDGWTADRAYAEMKQYHFRSFLHGGLKRFIYRYYNSIHPSPQNGRYRRLLFAPLEEVLNS